jgi:hypothetical protein
MLEISLINVIYKRIGKIWYITQSELNSCKCLQGGTFAVKHLYLQISDSHIRYEVSLG